MDSNFIVADQHKSILTEFLTNDEGNYLTQICRHTSLRKACHFWCRHACAETRLTPEVIRQFSVGGREDTGTASVTKQRARCWQCSSLHHTRNESEQEKAAKKIWLAVILRYRLHSSASTPLILWAGKKGIAMLWNICFASNNVQSASSGFSATLDELLTLGWKWSNSSLRLLINTFMWRSSSH